MGKPIKMQINLYVEQLQSVISSGLSLFVGHLRSSGNSTARERPFSSCKHDLFVNHVNQKVDRKWME
jgi:hypothetical protein